MYARVEEVFSQVQNSLTAAIGRKSEVQLRQMVKVKHRLAATSTRLGEMRGELQEGWRRVAATLLGESFDQKIEGQLKESEGLRAEVTGAGDEMGARPGEETLWRDLVNAIRLLLRGRCFDGVPSSD